jgi:hypothetical protein
MFLKVCGGGTASRAATEIAAVQQIVSMLHGFSS